MTSTKDFEEYERLVRKILEERILAEYPKAVFNVFSSREYRGQSGHEHQIDVSAELVLADCRILLLVECKKYRERVGNEDILAFACRIQDIGAHKGIVATTVGFQKGAKRIAESKGIALVVVQPDDSISWKVLMPALFPQLLLEKRQERIVRNKEVIMNTQVEEKSLGRFRFGGYVKSLCVSPDSRHVAYVARDMWRPFRRREFLVVDGDRGSSYDRISVATVSFGTKGQPIFVAVDQGAMFLVVGEQKGQSFEALSVPVVSQDGKRWAYVAKESGRSAVVVDGTIGPWFESISQLLVFSPDSKRVGYVARRGGRWQPIIDGSGGAEHDAFLEGSLSFSDDGSRFAYAVRDGSKWRAVIDGVAQESYQGIANGTPVFGPHGRHVIYAATDGHQHFVTVDGTLHGPYDGVGEGFAFSSDGVRFAFRARKGREWLVITDSGSSAAYENIPDSSVVLSANGQHLALVGHQRGKSVIVLDGTDVRTHDDIIHPTFSHDGKRMSYVARDGSRWALFLDNRRLTDCDGVTSDIVFSPDDQHVAIEVVRGRQVALSVDGKDQALVDFFLNGAQPIFDSSTSLHDLGSRQREYILLEIGL